MFVTRNLLPSDTLRTLKFFRAIRPLLNSQNFPNTNCIDTEAESAQKGEKKRRDSSNTMFVLGDT